MYKEKLSEARIRWELKKQINWKTDNETKNKETKNGLTEKREKIWEKKEKKKNHFYKETIFPTKSNIDILYSFIETPKNILKHIFFKLQDKSVMLFYGKDATLFIGVYYLLFTLN